MTELRIDNKHHVSAKVPYPGDDLEIQIVKTSNGQAIPEDEPVILFRGRDKLALPMLRHYRQLCLDDGCTEYQMTSMDDMIRRFQEFADASPTMKQPGCTLGK